jgi:hypothetical protein
MRARGRWGGAGGGGGGVFTWDSERYMKDSPGNRESLSMGLYEGKSLCNRNFILKWMEEYAQRKFLFRDTK